MLIKVTAIWNTVRVGTVCCVREGERVKEDKLDTQSAGLEARLDKGPITPLSDSDTGTRGTEPSLGFFEGVEIRISYSLISSWIWFSSGFCGAINISPNNAGSDLVAIVLLTVSRKKEEGKIVEIFFFLFLIYSSLLEPRGKMKMCFRWISVVWYGRLSYFGNGWNAAWKPKQARSKTLWDFIG